MSDFLEKEFRDEETRKVVDRAEIDRINAENEKRRLEDKRRQVEKDDYDREQLRQAEKKYAESGADEDLNQIVRRKREQKGEKRARRDKANPTVHSISAVWVDTVSVEHDREDGYGGRETYYDNELAVSEVNVQTDAKGRMWVNGRRVHGKKKGLHKTVAEAYRNLTS